MVIDHRDVEPFDGNTAYAYTDKRIYDCVRIKITKDMAWEIVNNLLSDLRFDEKELVLTFYEERK